MTMPFADGEERGTEMRHLRSAMVAVTVAALAVALAAPALAGGPDQGTTIQDGTLLGSDGAALVLGFDEWGYNYQARLFNGGYCDSYHDAAWCQPYTDVNLAMKWNDAWLSNRDRDDDGLLDRHYGFASYIGSGAWLTNHQSGVYEGGNGETCNWNYFVKIVAAPTDATLAGGFWLTADGTEIGPAIWGEFAIVQQVDNDSCAGAHGISYLSPNNAGFGSYGPHA